MSTTDNAPPSSFPSTFSRASSTAAISSSTPTTTAKSKRWSLNIVSPQPTSVPRPLHLSAGLVVASTPNSPSHSPSPGNVNSQLPSGWSKGGGGGIDSPSSASPAPSPSSSMTNIPANSDSPSRPNFSKRDSVDSLGLVRSPLSISSFDGGGSGGLERSSSLGGRRSKPLRSPAAGERSSTGTLEAKERPPVTLAEKHSELLHFIAQKESKCLELRSQLASHEAELLQLKRKWERIVNRGFEKALSPSNSSAASANSPATTTSLPATTTSPSSSPSSAFHPYSFSSNSSSSPATAGVDGMLEGIKGGVQGVSRLIAAGLGSIAQVVPAEQTAQSSSAAPLPLMLGGAPTNKRMSLMSISKVMNGTGHGHGQKESQSSTSTTSSFASSSLLSASSGTSATSASISGSSTSGNTTKRSAELETETESDFGDFEDGSSVQSHSHSHNTTQREQVLMVHDTGATPTMSPNPAFQRRRGPNDSETSNPDFQQPFGDGGEEKEDFDWDDGWEDSPGEAQASDREMTLSLASSSSLIAADSKSAAATTTTTTTTTTRIVGTHAGPKSPLAPMSAIPTGLASIAGAAPTAEQMSSWVGSVGKRWDEIKGSTTFTKNQKRASVLFSDMQQSLVSALASPGPSPASASASASSTAPYYSITPTTTAAGKVKVSSPPSSSSSKAHSTFHSQPQTQRGMSTSLLDDSDDESFGESGGDAGVDNTVRLAPVMVPDSKGVNRGPIQAKEKAKAKVDDDDEWNW
ncbi:hypothetical protein M413DRAFT_448998 [Hebeloma cylindrosporum]|uniref:Uncharacterized protein n=1 Tax=Hebeloma cylindrosporum TaxID=76867 RepID=A0A0C3BIZ6_HEBCY|nr:hypothetical protein M413DRAFT_448998 [Hebeloma cylindrosporum h7]